MRELLISQPIFIGFKADTRLREKLTSLKDSDRQYVSAEGTAYLQMCMVGEDLYVGKLVSDRLTTDRVEDIRHNILSILRKLGHEARLPNDLQILGCSPLESDKPALQGTLAK